MRRSHALEAVQERLQQERALRSRHHKATAADIEAALKNVLADSRNTWFRVGCALWHEFGEDGRLLWDAWSQGSAKFNRADQDKTWRSIRSKRVPKPITIGTVFALAKEGGDVGDV
jgi:hypothetical protein